jgi:hypothetical protein
MTTRGLTTFRAMLAGLALALMFGLSSPARGQPADELIAKLLDLSKEKAKLTPGKDDDELRQLLIARYNVAVEELKLRCEDFKKHLATKVAVVEAGKHLLEAELELQTKPADRLRVLERTADLLRWYEKRVEAALKDGLIPRAELLRVRFVRLSMEIDIAKTKQALGKGPAKKEP